MMTVHEVSRLTGVSIRALQYYDKIGLLPPAEYTESGYRLYDDASLERLQQILLFRELEFPLKDIRDIVSRPDFDREKALEQQIELLTLKKEHIENLIDLARGIQTKGVRPLSFEAFDTKKLEEYAAQALVKKLRSFISEHYYTCTDDILRGLGQMYTGGGEMTANIDRSGGEGTAAFAAAAIEVYCK